MSTSTTSIGILAIQGAVEEHAKCIRKLGANVKEIRKPEDFDGLDGIILPGGESTAMAIIGEQNGIFPILRDWVQAGKPVWGTCAGMILLSDNAIKQRTGGQSLVGGVDVHVCRNFFGPQINSCKIDIDIPISSSSSADIAGIAEDVDRSPFPAVFIRAPAILKVGPNVQVLSRMLAKPHRSARSEVLELLGNGSEGKGEGEAENEMVDVIVAARQDNILVTAFHPELTNDLRWHRYFMDIVNASRSSPREDKA